MESNKNRMITVLVISLLWFAGFANAQTQLPENFKQIQTYPKNIKKAIESVHNMAGNVDVFWFGYRFNLRPGVNFHNVRINDNGDISISRHRHGDEGDFFEFGDADLETVTLQALSNLGDEEAREKLKKKQPVSSVGNRHWGLFYQVYTEDNAVENIKLFNTGRRNNFGRHPVFWNSSVETSASADFLTAIVHNKTYSRKLLKTALFVLSLHDDNRVVQILSAVAAGNRSVEVRGSAAFWLGEIGSEKSLQSLMAIYPKENSRKMKEKLIFAISQHQSKQSLAFLANIARSDSDGEMRQKAVFWIGQDQQPSALQLLLQLLNETRSVELKEKIVFSISQHDSEEAIDALIKLARREPNHSVRKKAIFWLGQMAGKKSLSALGDIVEEDGQTEIKTKAVFAISQHDNEEEAADMLMKIARSNSNPEVRKKAIFWLGQIDSPRTIDFFKDILTPETRR